MGDVFLATDTRLGKAVALKLLKESLAIGVDAELRARFERECAICAALKSVHIVQVSDYGVAEGYPFYVMEYLQGQTLGQRLARETKLSVEQSCHIITQVCAGLHVAHGGVTMWNRETNRSDRIKVVHRDLKPDNIFLTPTALGEFVKIIDFGIAKIHSLQAEHTSASGLFLGTYHYASPEQSDGGRVDERSDIYSLGVILYEMLTGIDPFGLDFRNNRITNNAWLAAHALKPARPLRSHPSGTTISPQLEAIVLRCLKKSPADRFASVNDLRLALQTAIAQPPHAPATTDATAEATVVRQWAESVAEGIPAATTTLPINPAPRSGGWRRRQPWGVMAAVLVGAGAIGVYTLPPVASLRAPRSPWGQHQPGTDSHPLCVRIGERGGSESGWTNRQ
ncbi:MAG: serine/threonine protein kinase [Leptolyngbyaceae cyanobacterium SL_7_1]|nr:serine/threonine protein kinase [Leptolyngbyaceae cyanobacterium SL_7_1]